MLAGTTRSRYLPDNRSLLISEMLPVEAIVKQNREIVESAKLTLLETQHFITKWARKQAMRKPPYYIFQNAFKGLDADDSQQVASRRKRLIYKADAEQNPPLPNISQFFKPIDSRECSEKRKRRLPDESFRWPSVQKVNTEDISSAEDIPLFGGTPLWKIFNDEQMKEKNESHQQKDALRNGSRDTSRELSLRNGFRDTSRELALRNDTRDTSRELAVNTECLIRENSHSLEIEIDKIIVKKEADNPQHTFDFRNTNVVGKQNRFRTFSPWNREKHTKRENEEEGHGYLSYKKSNYNIFKSKKDIDESHGKYSFREHQECAQDQDEVRESEHFEYGRRYASAIDRRQHLHHILSSSRQGSSTNDPHRMYRQIEKEDALMHTDYAMNSKTPSPKLVTKNNKPGYLCHQCGKVYCRKYVLKIHQRVHSGEKPLECRVCGKCFSDPSNMKKHVKLHDSEQMTYPCKYCSRHFVRKRGLRNHIQSNHSKMPTNNGIEENSENDFKSKSSE